MGDEKLSEHVLYVSREAESGKDVAVILIQNTSSSYSKELRFLNSQLLFVYRKSRGSPAKLESD